MNIDELLTKNVKKVLLVEPDFPTANKSRNHSDFLPIGLLKIASYVRTKSIDVKLIRYENKKTDSSKQITLDDINDINNAQEQSFQPDLIFVTSIFTYWSKYVKQAVEYCRETYGDTPIVVGGIYASLMPDYCKEDTGCDYIMTGIIPEAEKLIPAYDLVDVDYQILHTTRGCIRQCGFCGTYIIEPEWICKKSIRNEIIKKKLVFYDNNFLANPHIENILKELAELKKQRKINYVESQSGFDGRILRKKPHLAKLIKEAGFKSPKIAWDWGIEQADLIKKQIDILIDGGYKNKDISVFMIYNWDIDYLEMEEKRVKCFEWGVQIMDCRYRPLDQTFDEYSSYKHKGQTSDDYHINPNWTDEEVRAFRRNVRRHNICVRHETDYHSNDLERKKIPQDKAKEYRNMSYEEAKKYVPDAWTPKEISRIK